MERHSTGGGPFGLPGVDRVVERPFLVGERDLDGVWRHGGLILADFHLAVRGEGGGERVELREEALGPGDLGVVEHVLGQQFLKF